MHSALTLLATTEGEKGEKKESKLVNYISDFSRQLEYLYKLINIIKQLFAKTSGAVLVKGTVDETDYKEQSSNQTKN